MTEKVPATVAPPSYPDLQAQAVELGVPATGTVEEVTSAIEAVTPAMAKYQVGIWAGLPNYGCPAVGCPFLTLDGAFAVEEHITARADKEDPVHLAVLDQLTTS